MLPITILIVTFVAAVGGLTIYLLAKRNSFARAIAERLQTERKQILDADLACEELLLNRIRNGHSPDEAVENFLCERTKLFPGIENTADWDPDQVKAILDEEYATQLQEQTRPLLFRGAIGFGTIIGIAILSVVLFLHFDSQTTVPPNGEPEVVDPAEFLSNNPVTTN